MPTALVNELYLKFIRSGSPFAPRNRGQFLALAAQSLRQILIDHARMRSAKKRGAGITVALISTDMPLPARDQDLLQLDKVLTRLEALDARAARVVELRFFGGLNEEEVAHNLQVSMKTVQRDWKMARAWLVSHLATAGERRIRPSSEAWLILAGPLSPLGDVRKFRCFTHCSLSISITGSLRRKQCQLNRNRFAG